MTEVATRTPRDEVAPEPQDGKLVVFAEHFSCGFGLPVSAFFRYFLAYFGLQPHHLGANSILQLSAFVAFCEGYISVLPTTDLWGRMFYVRPQTVGSEMVACVAAAVYL